MTGYWGLGFAIILLIAAAAVAMGWPRMEPRVRTPQQEARLEAAIKEEWGQGVVIPPGGKVTIRFYTVNGHTVWSAVTPPRLHTRCFDAWCDGVPSGMCGACFDRLGERAS